ncbi:anaphase-promoting complex subunit 15-like [Pieris rapae]|uniref:anaphase-promoting complex subunit 15-like n=1 Tax=Pieris rapae TaxID=64459 RepID=UPI001E27E5C3|nr:anaphase-promoting complex subunit 15-like [Pieris rapae]
MNIPFPTLMPRLVDTKWFKADSPCDEEAELTTLEQEHQHSLTSIIQKFTKREPIGKTEPETMEEEAESDEGNEESEDTEESHDEDEELRAPYSPSHNNNEIGDSVDDLQLPEE